MIYEVSVIAKQSSHMFSHAYLREKQEKTVRGVLGKRG